MKYDVLLHAVKISFYDIYFLVLSKIAKNKSFPSAKYTVDFIFVFLLILLRIWNAFVKR